MCSSASSDRPASRRLLPLRLALLSIGLVLAVASPGHAQSVGRTAGVMDRQRPDYDPTGVPLGGLRLYPSLTLSQSYTDNVFATETDTRSDFVTVLLPQVRLSSNWSRHSLSTELYGRFTRYWENDVADTDEYGGSLTGSLDLASLGTASGFASYGRGAQARTDPEAPDNSRPSLFDRQFLQLTYNKAFNRLLTRTEIEYERYDFQNEADRLLDRTELSAAAQIGYQLSPRIALFVRPVYRDRHYAEAGANGVSRDNKEYNLLVGVDFEVASLLIINFSIGALYATFDDPAYSALTGVAVNGTAQWFPTERLTVTASARRSTQATQQTLASTRLNTTVQMAADYELYRNVLVGARLSYREDEFAGTPRTDKTWGAGVGVRYLINRTMAAYSEIGTLHRTSTAARAGFDQTTVTVGLRLQL